MTVGEIIKRARIAKGLTSQQFRKALKLSIGQAYVSLVENDERIPTYSFVKRMCEVLDIPYQELAAVVIDKKVEKYRKRLERQYFYTES